MDGMPVYYGGDFNDSDCEDPRDLAHEDWLDWYNFNAPVMDIEITVPVGDIPMAGNDVPIAAESAEYR